MRYLRGVAAGRFPLRLTLAIGVPVVLAIAAAVFPQFPDHPAARAALALAAAALPAVFLINVLLRTRVLDDSVKQLARGDLAQALPSVDDEALTAVLLDLDGLRRTLQLQLREMGVSGDEQERALATARRSLGDLAAGVQRQVTAVDETAASLSQMSASLKGIAENVEVLASSAEESSASILEMAAANSEVSDNMATLAGSV